MFCSYGPVTFVVPRITDYQTEVVYSDDATTYLFDRISVRLICYLNPESTSYNGGNTPGIAPAISFNNIVSILRVPRQQLLIWQQDDPILPGQQNIILQSPVPGFSRDATNGPTCKVHRLDSFHGGGTLWFDLEFKTDINLCAGSPGYENPAWLSNRYGMRVTYDSNNYRASYEYAGEAIFRTDILTALALNPDLFRQSMLPSVIPRYQRFPKLVELSSNNIALKYVIEDRYTPKTQPLNQQVGVAQLIINEHRKYVDNFEGGGGLTAANISNITTPIKVGNWFVRNTIPFAGPLLDGLGFGKVKLK
jgi:hypothetical protein